MLHGETLLRLFSHINSNSNTFTNFSMWGIDNSSPKPRSAKLALKAKNSSSNNFGQEQKSSCPHMEKLFSINSSTLASRNCVQLVPSHSTQPKTIILENIQLGHKPTCDRTTVMTENVTKRGFDIRVRPNNSLNHRINA